MEMTSVVSSNVAEIGYDEENSILQVEFNNGGTYQYFDVPLREYERLRDASSVGTYLNNNIKGTYRFSKV